MVEENEFLLVIVSGGDDRTMTRIKKVTINANEEGLPSAKLEDLDLVEGDWYLATITYCSEHNKLILGDIKGS